MKDKDLLNLLKPVSVIDPAVYTDDNTPAAIDMKGYATALFLLHIGAGGITFTTTNKVEFKLTHSDDDSTYTAVTVDDLQGISSVGTGGIVKSLVAAHASASLTAFTYKGGKRYLKLLADFGGTHSTGTPLEAVVIKGGANILPAA